MDQFDHIYNTERPHQGLPRRLTPQQSWNATAIAEEPRPSPLPTLPEANAPISLVLSMPAPELNPGPEVSEASTVPGPENELNLETSTFSKLTGTIARPAGSGSQKLRVYSNGVVKMGSTSYFLTARMRGRTVIAAWDPRGVLFANTDGEVIAEYLWPPEGTGYVGNNKNLTRFRRGLKAPKLSPKS